MAPWFVCRRCSEGPLRPREAGGNGGPPTEEGGEMRCHMAQDLGTAARCGQVWGKMCSARPEAPAVSQSIDAPAAAAPVRQPINACMLARRDAGTLGGSRHDRQCVILPPDRRNKSPDLHTPCTPSVLRAPEADPQSFACAHHCRLDGWLRSRQRPDPIWRAGVPSLFWSPRLPCIWGAVVGPNTELRAGAWAMELSMKD